MGDTQYENRGPFPQTQWSLVQRATSAGEAAPEAMAALVTRYLPVLRSYLMGRRKMDADRADELLQGFMTVKVLEERILAKAEKGRGKFRTFLLTALDNYVIDEIRFWRAKRRGGSAAPADVDEMLELPSPDQGPDRSFDIAWARQVLSDAEARMRDECQANGRADLWGVFEDRVLRPAMEGSAPVDYEVLVSRYGFCSPGEASNAMITSKRAFARHLRAVVSEYAGGEAEADAEIRDLYRIVSGRRAG